MQRTVKVAGSFGFGQDGRSKHMMCEYVQDHLRLYNHQMCPHCGTWINRIVDHEKALRRLQGHQLPGVHAEAIRPPVRVRGHRGYHVDLHIPEDEQVRVRCPTCDAMLVRIVGQPASLICPFCGCATT